jgi:phage terminase large subunit-like protein
MLESDSLRESLLSLPQEERAGLLAGLTDADAAALLFDWRVWARAKQLAPPGDWRVWLIKSGRGFGKTRTAAEWVRERAEAMPGSFGALVGPTPAQARDIMVEGESGLLAISPPWFRPEYEPAKRRLTWPNGTRASIFSAFEFDHLRGPQHHWAWAEEVAAWKHASEAWEQLDFGLRLGVDPRCVATTTPRPIRLVRDLLKHPGTVVTSGSTYENRANLARPYLDSILAKYEGTRLGRQEIHGEVLDDVPGALWQRAPLDELRVTEAPELVRLVVAVDPAVTSGEDSDETGIVAAGKGVDGHYYVLGDWTCRLSPDAWAQRAVGVYHELRADRLVAEVNQGGDMVERVVRTVDKRVAYKAVRATRGKRTRAEPIAALYEQGKVHHTGTLDLLEDQMCCYVPDAYDGSPDRVDALVWALTELSEGARKVVLL